LNTPPTETRETPPNETRDDVFRMYARIARKAREHFTSLCAWNTPAVVVVVVVVVVN